VLDDSSAKSVVTTRQEHRLTAISGGAQKLPKTWPAGRARYEITHALIPPSIKVHMLFEHSEHLEPRPVDLTADVTLACLIVCEQHIARSENVLLAVADFNLGVTTHMHYELTARCYVVVPHLRASFGRVAKENRFDWDLCRHRPGF
jgi:hypothetical protein